MGRTPPDASHLFCPCRGAQRIEEGHLAGSSWVADELVQPLWAKPRVGNEKTFSGETITYIYMHMYTKP